MGQISEQRIVFAHTINGKVYFLRYRPEKVNGKHPNWSRYIKVVAGDANKPPAPDPNNVTVVTDIASITVTLSYSKPKDFSHFEWLANPSTEPNILSTPDGVESFGVWNIVGRPGDTVKIYCRAVNIRQNKSDWVLLANTTIQSIGDGDFDSVTQGKLSNLGSDGSFTGDVKDEDGNIVFDKTTGVLNSKNSGRTVYTGLYLDDYGKLLPVEFQTVQNTDDIVTTIPMYVAEGEEYIIFKCDAIVEEGGAGGGGYNNFATIKYTVGGEVFSESKELIYTNWTAISMAVQVNVSAGNIGIMGKFEILLKSRTFGKYVKITNVSVLTGSSKFKESSGIV